MSTKFPLIQLPREGNKGFQDLSQTPKIPRKKAITIQVITEPRALIYGTAYFDENEKYEIAHVAADGDGIAHIIVEVTSDTCSYVGLKLYVERGSQHRIGKYLIMCKVVD